MLNLFFPKYCNGCGAKLLKNETILCATCRHKLPLACFHRFQDETMKNIFYGRFPIENATALIQFQKQGITQQIMHNLKYRGQEGIAVFFGKWLGAELSQLEAFRQIEMVVPVPLHKQRLKKRGYNQVSGFGREIAKSLSVPFREDILLKVSQTDSQVFKKRASRFDAEGIFTLAKPEAIFQKHLLLVDDIVTTGATLERCAAVLLKETHAKLSVATIAIA
ncbi:MAG: amidophosphoribosyltransferase [Alteromonas sp.]|nr:amidophosphoribosyltransferase [Alteromonas sp.]MAY21281.1 amidophosphoribosyltransferase [Flavobacteriaceae bacterium]|tara:strand:- start:44249 stop:44911 length:663 start_codon:yes stop_codon:yes gene_type:complete